MSYLTNSHSKSISHYRIVKKLGEGGMGEVYLAEDTRLNRTVALKILPATVSQDRQRVARFLQEARAAAALQHPHIAHVYEIGQAGDVNFIAMEHVEGQTLDVRIASGAVDVAEIIEVGMQTADALSEAHGKGITHRDIKPSNLMITSRGGVKVLDFGLAKINAASNAGAESDIPTAIKTDPGLVVGTVAYMSPEQALGNEIDHRTDIFSLGVVLYEMATGRKPFLGKTPTDTINRIANVQPEAIARFNYNSTPELERIIRKALEKDRERRYQSARELLTDLRNLQRDSVSTPVAAAARQTGLVRRAWPYVLLAIVLLSLVGLTAFYLLTKNQAIDSVVVLPFANQGGDPNMEYLSDGISENLINRLSQLPNLRVVPRSTAFRYKGKDSDPQGVGRALRVRAVIVGRVVQRGDTLSVQAELIDVTNESQLWGQQYNRKVTDLLVIQDDIARRITENLRLRVSDADRHRLTKRDTENTEAYQLYLKGRYFWAKRTEDGFRKAIEHFQQAIDLDPEYSRAYAGLADCYNFLGAFGIALMPPKDTMPNAKLAARRALEIDESLPEAHASSAFVSLYYDWDWVAAEREFQRAIELNPNYAPAHQWYSHLLMTSGRNNESLVEAKRAMEIDPLSLATSMNLGWQYHWSRDYDAAIAQLKSTIEMDANFEQAHWALGLACERKGLVKEALAEFQNASKLSGGNPVYEASLGHAYATAGRRAEAMKIRDQLELRSKTSYVPPYWMATLNTGLGDKDEAFRWLEKAYEERSGGLVWLNADPRLDDLRQDARFKSLEQRVRESR